MADKSKKLYKDSPTVKKDSEGKPGISKPKPSDKEDMGLEGGPIPGAGEEMPVDIHEQERQAMYKRHQEEFSSMSERHLKDHKEMYKRHLDFNKNKLSGTPAEDIKDKE